MSCITFETNGDENCCLDEDARSQEGIKLRNGLRNGLRSHNKRSGIQLNGTQLNGTQLNGTTTVKKLGNSLFDQLIKEAKTRPSSDFELVLKSSSLLVDEQPCPINGFSRYFEQLNQSNFKPHSTDCSSNESSSRKVNKRKNQIEFIEDFEDSQFEVDSGDQNNMNEFDALSTSELRNSSRNSQNDSSLKELRNFKNLKTHQNSPNRTTVSHKAAKRNQHSTKTIQVKPIQRISIDNNLFKYNDGLVSADAIDLDLNASNKYVLKRRNQQYIFERLINHEANLDETNSESSRRPDHQLSRSKRRPNEQFRKSNSIHHSITDQQAVLNKCLFSSSNESAVFDLYTFQDKTSPNLDLDSCQTSVVALIQLEQISIWTQSEPTSQWKSTYFKLDNQQVFRCTKIEQDNCICILFLVCSHSLVSLKYCLIDKATKSVQLVHGETFEVSSNSDLDLIHLCSVNPSYLALSIPRIDDHVIDVLIYDQFKLETKFNKSKRIIYMLNNVDNKFSSESNCFLASDELDHTFVAIFNQKLFMW